MTTSKFETFLDDADLQHRLQAERDKRFRTLVREAQGRLDVINSSTAGPQAEFPGAAIKDGPPGGSTPSQYGLPEGVKDLQDLIEYRKMNFALGNIFKACYRRGTCSHSDELRDMRKVLWFAQREVARLEREERERTSACCGHARQQELDEEAGNDGYPDA